MNPDAEPVAMASSSGATCSGSTPSVSAIAASSSRVVSVRCSGHSVRPSRGDGLCELGDGVVVDQAGAVGGDAVGDEAHPDQRLLPRLQQVRALAADRDRVAADLADRLGRAVEELGMPVDEPARPDPAARLLVGEERHDELALGQRPRPEDVAERGRASSRPCPSCRRRRDPTASRRGPRRRTGRRSSCARRPAPRRGARAARARACRGRVPARARRRSCGAARARRARREAEGGELRLDVLGGLALPLRPPLAVVGRVESDEIPGDHRGLVELGDRLLDCG